MRLGLTLLFVGVGTILWGCHQRAVIPHYDEFYLQTSDSVTGYDAFDHFIRGAFAEITELYPVAAAEYGMAWLYDPQSLQIPLSLARIYFSMGETGAMVRVLKNALKSHPDNYQLMRKLFEIHFIRREYRESLPYVLTLIKSKALSWDEVFEVIRLFEHEERNDELQRVCQEALKHYGKQSLFYIHMGWAEVRKENYERAEAYFRNALSLDSLNDKLYFFIANFQIIRQKVDQALPLLEKAIQINREDVTYWKTWIEGFGILSQWERLDSAAAVALQIFPNEPSLWYWRGRAYEDRGELDKASACYDSALARDSTFIDAYIRKAYIFHNEKDWEKAMRYYEQSLAIEPDNPVLLNNYAYMLAESVQDLNRALDMIEKALKAQPENASFWDTRAWVLYRLGRYEEALEDIKRALKNKSEENGEIYEHLGHIYEALGDKDGARKAFERALKLSPKNAYLQEYLNRMKNE
ncbi:MAG: tetratricopeptide repeat protein [bacterium]